MKLSPCDFRGHKSRSGRLLRAHLRGCAALALASTVTVACGDKSADPKAVTLEDLKNPGNLTIQDLGNGAATLQWSGSNNEDDFDGYNVYGMIGTASDLGVTEGEALKLLDDEGEPVQAARDVLAKFNYSTDKKLTAAADVVTDKDGKTEFSALPMHTGKDKDKLLPTCKAVDGACTMTTAENKDKTAKDANYAVNGTVTFTVPDTMVVGSSYCFLVLSSMDNGEKVSQTSSNAACFVPKYKATFDLSLPSTQAESVLFAVNEWMETCTATGCEDPNSTSPAFIQADSGLATNGVHKGQDPGAFYVETANSLSSFVAGKNSAIIDLGFYAKGLEDPTLSPVAPKLVLDTNTYGSGDGVAPIFNQGGYSLAGQSVLIQKNHVYVIAVGDGTETNSTEFNYHWLYVNGDVTPGSDVAVEMRLSKNKE